MKKFSWFLALALAVSLLAGCAGTPVVYYSDCDCPEGSHQTPVQDTTNTDAEPFVPAEGAVKTGLYIGTDISESRSATAEELGEAKYDVTLVAVTVDDQGIIQSCVIDSVPATIRFDAHGTTHTDLMGEVPTKNELGESYGMKAYGGAKYEWNEQVAALAEYAVGKTVEELRSGAVSESGHAVDADLASTATIYLGGYVDAIEAAAENARYVGSQYGDELRLAAISTLMNSGIATAEEAGVAQLDVDVTALTMDGETITGCVIDSLQAKIAFDNTGVITTDLSAPIRTKNELGEAYGMKAYGGATHEWNEQAAAFAAYATGKTAAEVAGLAVSEGNPADADMLSTVTISVGGFQDIIQKAAQ